METTTENHAARSDVLASFLMPHILLDMPSLEDSPDARSAKQRANRIWLRRWLPTYIIRWALIFLVMWMGESLVADWDLPLFLDWTLEFAMCASGGLALGFTCLYGLGHLGRKR